MKNHRKNLYKNYFVAKFQSSFTFQLLFQRDTLYSIIIQECNSIHSIGNIYLYTRILQCMVCVVGVTFYLLAKLNKKERKKQKKNYSQFDIHLYIIQQEVLQICQLYERQSHRQIGILCLKIIKQANNILSPIRLR